MSDAERREVLACSPVRQVSRLTAGFILGYLGSDPLVVGVIQCWQIQAGPALRESYAR